MVLVILNVRVGKGIAKDKDKNNSSFFSKTEHYMILNKVLFIHLLLTKCHSDCVTMITR